MPQKPGPSNSSRWLTIALLTLGTWSVPAAADSLRYFGGFSANDVDRVKIQIDNPDDNNPGPPADVGSTDFTVEFFMKAAGQNNESGGCSQNGWTSGNIVIDRDRFGLERDYGISLGNGIVHFGVTGAGGGQDTLCGTSDLRDGQWHHIAVQRRRSDGWMEIFVDGIRQAQVNGPDGDISYPDNGIPEDLCGPNGGQSCRNSDPFLVIGAEKHNIAWGFNGWVDELRISNVLRYSASPFPPTTIPFDPSIPNTVALYHFDEGTGDTIVDATAGNQSPGVRRFGQGGGSQAGPAWSTDSPFNPSPGTLQFSMAQFNVQENAGQATVTVTRVGGSSGAASVSFTTADGTATAGADYSTVTTILSWMSGDATSRTVQIPIIDDAAPESAESFSVQLSGASGASLGGQSSAMVSIAANDQAPAPGTLQWSAANYAVTEGSANVTLTVNRVTGSSGAVTVSFTTSDGSAVAGSDYTTTAATLSFADGETAKTITVPILDDGLVESGETLTVSLSAPSAGATLGTPSSATVTISDNDQSPPSGDGGGGGATSWWEFVLGLLALLAHRGQRVRRPNTAELAM